MDKMIRSVSFIILLVLLLSPVYGSPLGHHESEAPSLSDLGSRVVSKVTSLQEPRLPLPTLQDIETIKKVAQILVMLGEQVLPTVIGDQAANCCDTSPPSDSDD